MENGKKNDLVNTSVSSEIIIIATELHLESN